MPDLLLELFSEEIPARMQGRAAADLERMMNERLLSAGFMPDGVKAFAGPRRLALIATGLPLRQPDRKEEKKGPRVGAPEKAIEGFLKSAGLSSVDQCEIAEDKKGQYYVAKIEEKGKDTAAVIAAAVPDIIRDFPWPKSMRWGAPEDNGDLRWVRPLHSILCSFNDEVVPFEIGGVKSGDRTEGHRRYASAPLHARNFDKYVPALTNAKVMLDGAARSEMIAADAKTLCEAQGLELVEDKGLLAEVSGLAEWPVVMIGSFDEKFLALPDEVLTATMRGHQKYFSVKSPKTGRLANKFVFVANIEASDGGKAMRAGYERVLTARLSDAWYLYHQDLKTPLEDRVKDLDRVTFFEGLGSIGDKARRIAALAREIAPKVGADPDMAEKAALLAKADLTTGMVYEFPELQGLMGRYYYLAQHSSPLSRKTGEGPGVRAKAENTDAESPSPLTPLPQAGEGNVAIADAIRDHYKPQGADDTVPTAPVSVAVALADKIDTLTAFFSIGKKPTGSSDPFALRRAALGVIAVSLDNQVRFSLAKIIETAQKAVLTNMAERQLIAYRVDGGVHPFLIDENGLDFGPQHRIAPWSFIKQKIELGLLVINDPNVQILGDGTKDWVFPEFPQIGETSKSVSVFFHDRLKVYLRDKNHRHDHIDAVLTKADGALEDDLVLIVMKLEALEAFLKTDDGANLAAAYKRAANILKVEEKKDVGRAEARQNDSEPRRDEARPTVDEKLLQQQEEKALYAALVAAEKKAGAAVADEKFEDAMSALASLRSPIDAFFDKVTVNDPDAGKRANRLALLQRFIAATAGVADLGKLEG